MTKILYIAGCSRSGSTLLERILNSHEKLFAMGELSFFLDLIYFDPESKTCKFKGYESEFWSKVGTQVWDEFIDHKDLNNNLVKIESLTGLKDYVFGYPSDRKSTYKQFNQKLFQTIQEHLPKEVEYLLDSSKTARLTFLRPLTLSRIANCEVKVLHLVRDGRGCIWSYLKGSNRKLEQGVDAQIPFAALRCSFTWFISQTAAHLFQFLRPSENYIRVRYEDFIDDPEKILQQLGTFVGVDFSHQIKMLKDETDIPIADQISGNRVRNESKIRLKKDVAWKKNLSWYHQLLFWLLDWPYALLYGYKVSAGND